MTELPRGLCHYTNGQGFLGIVDKRELWATHVFYLNDHTEYQLAYETSKSLLERLYRLRDLADEVPRLRDAVLEHLTPFPRGRPAAVFVTSFTEKWDDLSQWRGYTSPGDGYGLVFDPALLATRAQAAGWRLEKCLYGTEGEARLIPVLLDVFTRYKSGQWSDDDDGAMAAVDELGTRILTIAPVIKHEAFRAESEWRLISPAMDDMRESFSFRLGRSFIVPYLAFPYAEPQDNSIIHVNVGPGPNADLAAHAAGTVIIQRGLRCGYGRATAPYRPW